MLTKFKSLKIFKKFLLLTFLAVGPLFVISHIVNINSIDNKFEEIQKSEAEKLKQQLEEKGKFLLNTFGKISSTPLMSSDLYSLQTYADELMKDEEVEKVVFLNQSGDSVVNSGVFSEDAIVYSDSVITDKEKLGVEMYVGTIVLALSPKHINKNMDELSSEMKTISTNTSMFILISNSVMLIIILLASYFLVLILVNKPIGTLLKVINKVSGKIEQGDLSDEELTEELENEFIPIYDGLTNVIKIFKSPLELSLSSIDLLSKGEELTKVSVNSQGDFGKLEKNINSLVDIFDIYEGEITNVIEAVKQGKNSTRADDSSVSGSWKKMISGVNSIIDELMKPVHESVIILTNLAIKDLTKLVEGNYVGDNALLKNNLNGAITNLKTIIGTLKDFAIELDQSTNNIGSVTKQISYSLNVVSNDSNDVSKLTQEMNSNLNNVAAAIEEVSINSQTISGNANDMTSKMDYVLKSVEDLVVSINRIQDSANEATSISKNAIDESNSASMSIEELNKSANDIGKVTEVIKKIAEQTNLLALNATIEAASAGEAGKGFAVVASEIKELANQSAKAAGDIAEKIEQVQTNTATSVKSISLVSTVINKINSSIIEISNSVQSQNKSSGEISKNMKDSYRYSEQISNSISEISYALNDVSQNVGDVAQGFALTSENIDRINQNINENSKGVIQISNSAVGLKNMSDTLSSIVSEFKV